MSSCLTNTSVMTTRGGKLFSKLAGRKTGQSTERGNYCPNGGNKNQVQSANGGGSGPAGSIDACSGFLAENVGPGAVLIDGVKSSWLRKLNESIRSNYGRYDRLALYALRSILKYYIE